MAKTATRVPWKRANPRKRAGKATKHLSPTKKAAAKASARRAGRPYPNLVDNMRMAAKSKKKAAKKKTAKKTTRKRSSAKKKGAKKSARKKSASAREKDPKGGLTAA